MGFAERNGFVKEKTVQVDEIDRSLRNRLYNMVHRFSESSPMIHEELEYVVDRLGYQLESTTNRNWYIINTVLEGEDSSIPWYMPYEVIELFFEAKRLHCKECEYRSDNSCEYCGYTEWFRNVTTDINIMLEQEKSGYRLLNDKFVNIISDEELQEINKIIDSPYQAVKIHINKALVLYSDRKKPDYENSIKESISAVESLCCIITGSTLSESVFTHKVNTLGLENMFVIDSAATSREEIGNPPHRGTVNKLRELGIPLVPHRARQVTLDDYDKFDYIIGMDTANIRNLNRMLKHDPEGKVYKLLSFAGSGRDIADPWYTGDFDETYRDVEEGSEGFLNYLREKGEI